jgi:hypothetical protein
MIALEIQGLSERRENLLIEVGRTVLASGFTLQRQRLAMDHHGVLLTMVVRGPVRKQRALSDALEAQERLLSFVISEFDESVQKPHFAASTTHDPAAFAPSPLAAAVAPPAVKAVTVEPDPGMPEPFIAPASEPEPDMQLEVDAFLASVSVPARAPSPAPATALETIDPFVELALIDADVSAVDKLMPKLINHYPDILPGLLTLQQSVAEAARESSLLLAGQRLGAWVFDRDHTAATKLNLVDAVESIGVPALRALVVVEQRGEQLHILDSPMCIEGGNSSCQFFNGYLEGVLRPAMPSDSVSIFSVCCRSYGAGECVFAISEG